MGHEVVEVTDGRQVIAAFRERTPDLVMLDVDMPVMTSTGVVSLPAGPKVTR